MDTHANEVIAFKSGAEFTIALIAQCHRAIAFHVKLSIEQTLLGNFN